MGQIFDFPHPLISCMHVQNPSTSSRLIIQPPYLPIIAVSCNLCWMIFIRRWLRDFLLVMVMIQTVWYLINLIVFKQQMVNLVACNWHLYCINNNIIMALAFSRLNLLFYIYDSFIVSCKFSPLSRLL